MTFPRTPWRFDSAAELADQLAELAHYLDDVHQALLFGPVDGSYLSLHFGHSVAAGLTATTVDLLPFSFEARPIAFYASVDSGSLDVQLYQDTSTAVLAADLTLATNAEVTTGGGFALRRLGGSTLQLDVTVINSGTPTRVSALLIVKAVSKIEPA